MHFSGVILLSTLLGCSAQFETLCPGQPSDPWAQVRCPATATCSPNGFSQGKGWGCCPFVNATSCPNGYACCPSGSTCALISGSGYSAVYSCQGGSAAPNQVSACPCKPGAAIAPSTTKKNVLVIGDSLSIGYTPSLAANLSDIAQVVHAPWDVTDGGAEESRYFEQCVDYWLVSPSGLPWTPDVIVFNSGMHNLVVNGSDGHGTVPGQSDNAADYASHFQAAVARLVQFAAASNGKTRLLMALTTPYLCSTQLDGIITGTLNPAATAVAQGLGIPLIDPHAAIVAKCGSAPVQSCFGLQGCWCPHCPPVSAARSHTQAPQPLQPLFPN